MNNKLLHFICLRNIPKRDPGDGRQNGGRYKRESYFAPSILLATPPDIFDYDAIIFKSLAWLWVIFIVFNLFPADASNGNQLLLKVWTRYIPMLFEKFIDGPIQVFVGLFNCWIYLKRFHFSKVTKAIGNVTLPVNYPTLRPYSLLRDQEAWSSCAKGICERGSSHPGTEWGGLGKSA